MKRNKFIILSLFFVFMIALSVLAFSACGADDSDGKDGTTNQTQQGGSGNTGDNSGNIDPSTHSHEFSNVWSSDDTTHWHAATCGHSDKKDEAPHTYVNGVCTTCNHAHENHSYGDYTADDSNHTHTCTVCQKWESVAHSWDNGTIQMAATVLTPGLKIFKCTVCRETKYEEIPVISHNHNYTSTWTSDKEYHWHVCATCSIADNKVPHVWKEEKIIKMPTSTEAGVKQFICDICGMTKTEAIQSGHTSNSFTYAINVENTAYFVTGFDGESQEVVIPDTYNGLRVIGIDKSAFKGNLFVKRVKLPNSIEIIGDSAFENCNSLTKINIPESIKTIGNCAFKNCSLLTDISFVKDIDGTPATKLEIQDEAFYGCTALNSLEFAENTNSIGINAFAGCYNLQKIVFNEGLTTIGDFAFDNCALKTVELPAGLTALGMGTFRNNQKLTSVAFPSALKEIPVSCFQNCVLLESIDLPERIAKIGASAFSCCFALKDLAIRGAVTFGHSAFYRAENLSEIYYDSSTKTGIENENYIFYNAGINCKHGICLTIGSKGYIPRGLFEAIHHQEAPNITSIIIEEGGSIDCLSIGNYFPKVTSIIIPDSLTAFGKSAFTDLTSLKEICAVEDSARYQTIAGDLYSSDGSSLVKCAFVKEAATLEIPETVTTIESGACSGLPFKTIIISNNVTSIGEAAFFNCISLETIYWNVTNCKTAGSSSSPIFSGCTALTAVHIGEKVESIPGYAFRDCTNLTSITIPNSVTSIGEAAFSGCSNLESITLPFIGNGSSKTHLGYLFGASSYSYNSSYVSSSLKTVIITGGGSIGSYAFYNCTGLTSITIPDSVISIGDSAFKGCTSLESINVDENNSAYSSQDGILYNKDKTTFLHIPKAIKGDVTIPNSVTSIGSSAFEYCASLATVYYGGNKTQWNSISIYSYNYNLTNATRYYFSETVPDTAKWAESDNWWHYDPVTGEIAIWKKD